MSRDSESLVNSDSESLDMEDYRVTSFGGSLDFEISETPTIDVETKHESEAMKALREQGKKKLEDLLKQFDEQMELEKKQPKDSNKYEIVPNIEEQKAVDAFLSLIEPNRPHLFAKLKAHPDNKTINPAIQLFHHWHDLMLRLTDPSLCSSELCTRLVGLLKNMSNAANSESIVSTEDFADFFHKHISTTNPSILPFYQSSPIEYFIAIVKEISKEMKIPCSYDASGIEGPRSLHDKFISEKFNSWTSNQLISQIALIKRCKTCNGATASWAHVWNLDIQLPEKSPLTSMVQSQARQTKKIKSDMSLSILVNEQYQGMLRSKSENECSKCSFDENSLLTHNFARLPSILVIKMNRNAFGASVTIEPNITLSDLDGKFCEYRLVVCIDRTIDGFGVIVLDKERMARIVDDTVIDPLSPDLAEKYMNSGGELFWFVSKEAH